MCLVNQTPSNSKGSVLLESQHVCVPVIKSYKSPTTCSTCGILLLGLWNQGNTNANPNHNPNPNTNANPNPNANPNVKPNAGAVCGLGDMVKETAK